MNKTLILILSIIISLYLGAYLERATTKTDRDIIMPEEISQAKTGDKLIVIYADSTTIDLGFDNPINH